MGKRFRRIVNCPLTVEIRPGPDPRLAEQPRSFQPRPVPTPRELVCAELWHRLGGALGFVGASARGITQPRQTAATVVGTIEGLAEGVATAVRPASPTPLNVAIGPHRRFDWTAMDLVAVKAVRAGLGGTINDVVLAVVAGAMRRYLGARRVDVDRLDFRAIGALSFPRPHCYRRGAWFSGLATASG